MKFDLKNMSRKELEKLKADVDKALDKANEKDKKAARDAAAKAAASFGFDLTDVVEGAAPKKTRRKSSGPAKPKGTAKYRNPADANQTWTGRGRQPEWFKAEVGKGTDPKTMEV